MWKICDECEYDGFVMRHDENHEMSAGDGLTKICFLLLYEEEEEKCDNSPSSDRRAVMRK